MGSLQRSLWVVVVMSCLQSAMAADLLYPSQFIYPTAFTKGGGPCRVQGCQCPDSYCTKPEPLWPPCSPMCLPVDCAKKPKPCPPAPVAGCGCDYCKKPTPVCPGPRPCCHDQCGETEPVKKDHILKRAFHRLCHRPGVMNAPAVDCGAK